ncbi:lytic transglycosylase domain-containing protein [Paraburkholderia adhaesiva]|uniref:lytic transglycosylase domain-containing protein n=1 Tax=Paraburkholderia adhaesiva TaxID=2883244 RepID=UPI001F421230|nr:transglycosylase SLT domain-containing protein [Paraburkholderia adhaesiva]
MRRFLCLVVLLPGLLQQAWAQQSPATDTISAYLTQRFGVAKQKAVQISAAVTAAAQKYSLPPAVLLAIISIESRFREKARGPRGATGLMQVVPSAHRDLVRHVKDLTNPDVNIDLGSSILYGYMRDAGGNLDAAMKVYGGSYAYAQTIESRAVEFAPLFDAAKAGPDAASGSSAPVVFVSPDAYEAASAVSDTSSPAAAAASGSSAVPAVANRAN